MSTVSTCWCAHTAHISCSCACTYTEVTPCLSQGRCAAASLGWLQREWNKHRESRQASTLHNMAVGLQLDMLICSLFSVRQLCLCTVCTRSRPYDVLVSRACLPRAVMPNTTHVDTHEYTHTHARTYTRTYTYACFLFGSTCFLTLRVICRVTFAHHNTHTHTHGHTRKRTWLF